MTMKSIWNTALNILARREHSQFELQKKLSTKFPEASDEIQDVLARLIESGLQDDERFCEMWFRYQVSKGRGPNRIRMEAKQKGVAEPIGQLIESGGIDWFELCEDCLKRKFSRGLSYDERPKAYRFLAYRGFAGDAISHAIGQCLFKD